ncbi:MAG TPA: response regulator transcription factor [Candidatus Limnocylindrales bacterium]|nr:response regulator transcription factor [Candidatus Limnocylindrales bacterium]
MAQRRTPPTVANLETIRIVLIEPRALVGLGIRGVLDGQPDMEVVAEVRSADDALAAVEERAPDIFVIDVELQEPSTSAATRRLTQEAPGSGIVVVGREDDDASILDAIEIGATGHVPAAAEPSELVAVIRRVADGEDPLRDEVIGRPDLIDRIMDGFRESFRRSDEAQAIPLTPRELDVLRHVAAGLRNREVGDLLDVSEQTVKNHLSSILHKLGVPNRTHAVTFAVRQGWLSLDDIATDDASSAVATVPDSVTTVPAEDT